MQLLLNNKESPKRFAVENNDSESITIYLYDAIGDYYGGISAKDFVQAISNATAKVINLRINCPGGDVFAARAMATAIKQTSAKVIAHIDGYAASAITYVTAQCDEVRISSGGFYMIHNAWTVAAGNANELEKTIDLLRKVDDSIAADYVKKTGGDLAQIKQWMDAETWFTADEALSEGFVDAVDDAEPAQACWNLSAYKNPPKPQDNIDKSAADRRMHAQRYLDLLVGKAA